MNNFETHIAIFKILPNNKIQKKYKINYQHLFQYTKFKKLLNIKSNKIINLYEINIKDKTLIYEYFPSVNLRERLKSNQEISYIEMIRIFKKMALSIDFLHIHKIAHIDINDTNFLINQELNVKLNDYDFIEIIENKNQNLKQIDILAFAILIYRIIQLPYQWNAIKTLVFKFKSNNIDYSSCEKFLDSLNIKGKKIND